MIAAVIAKLREEARRRRVRYVHGLTASEAPRTQGRHADAQIMTCVTIPAEGLPAAGRAAKAGGAMLKEECAPKLSVPLAYLPEEGTARRAHAHARLDPAEVWIGFFRIERTMELPVEQAAAIDVMTAELEQAGLTVFKAHVALPLYSCHRAGA